MFSFDTDVNAVFTPAQALAEEILTVIRSIYNYTLAHVRPYDVDDLNSTTKATFFGKINNLKLGHIVDAGAHNLPEYVSWTSLLHDNTEVTVW